MQAWTPLHLLVLHSDLCHSDEYRNFIVKVSLHVLVYKLEPCADEILLKANLVSVPVRDG